MKGRVTSSELHRHPNDLSHKGRVVSLQIRFDDAWMNGVRSNTYGVVAL